MSGDRLYTAFTWLLYLGISLIIWPLLRRALGKFGLGYFFLISLLILILTVYGSTAIHEIGHVVAGKLVRMKFRYVVIGPLLIQRENSHLRIVRNIHSRSIGAVTGMVLPDVHHLRQRITIYIAGGPLASLILVIIFTASSLAFANNHSSLPAVVFLCAGLLSFGSFLPTMLPVRRKGLPTDGRRLLDLLGKRPQVTRWAAIIAINAMYESGQRPRDWDERLVEQATLLPDGTVDYLAGLSIAYYHSLDNGQADGAGMWLDKIAEGLRHIVVAYRPGFQLELAYFTAMQLQDAPQARAWLNQVFGGIDIERSSYLCAEAAVLLAENKPQEAHERAIEGIAALDFSQSIGFKVFQRDRLQHIIDQVKL